MISVLANPILPLPPFSGPEPHNNGSQEVDAHKRRALREKQTGIMLNKGFPL
jgi:hypothetical protein